MVSATTAIYTYCHTLSLHDALPSAPSVVPARAGGHPMNVGGHAVYSEFFPMLDVPFLHGSGWSAQDDAQAAAVVVISSKLNQKLFAGGDRKSTRLNSSH